MPYKCSSVSNVNLIKTILQGHALWAIQLWFIDAKMSSHDDYFDNSPSE